MCDEQLVFIRLRHKDGSEFCVQPRFIGAFFASSDGDDEYTAIYVNPMQDGRLVIEKPEEVYQLMNAAYEPGDPHHAPCSCGVLAFPPTQDSVVEWHQAVGGAIRHVHSGGCFPDKAPRDRGGHNRPGGARAYRRAITEARDRAAPAARR